MLQQCLQESKSDILLEKCRRAFKKVEGGGGKLLVDYYSVSFLLSSSLFFCQQYDNRKWIHIGGQAGRGS